MTNETTQPPVTLWDYVNTHTKIVRPEDMALIGEKTGLVGADVIFFAILKSNESTAENLLSVIHNHQGEFGVTVDPMDGVEHSYLELGAWAGDQGIALRMMGLGAALGIWNLYTPRMLKLPEDMVQQMAGMGMISIKAAPHGI